MEKSLLLLHHRSKGMKHCWVEILILLIHGLMSPIVYQKELEGIYDILFSAFLLVYKAHLATQSKFMQFTERISTMLNNITLLRTFRTLEKYRLLNELFLFNNVSQQISLAGKKSLQSFLFALYTHVHLSSISIMVNMLDSSAVGHGSN